MSTLHETLSGSGLGWECSFGHVLHQGNTGWQAGEAYCLDCVALAHQAVDATAGRLVLTMLNLAPFPTRVEVGS